MVWLYLYLLVGAIWAALLYYHLNKKIKAEEAGEACEHEQSWLQDIRHKVQMIPGGIITMLLFCVFFWLYILTAFIIRPKEK